ncbi:retrovirus-related Pol polyprotein from transposon TNT 1-94 [Trifolium medium]|uniref:Retrovirus-related Pol polyprotein from transposon TNT 1-94 n=1 Tax=Trifolium medium TaxID=97028 RepID=A0A392M1B7_9FABA|nr:retrovirus-related Pol polyprotein from transposon TNT 1-94 [Trifolium medium]
MGKRLVHLKDSLGGDNWCVVRDFNSILLASERRGSYRDVSRGTSTEIREFNKFVGEMSLLDMPLLGRHFTWFQPNGGAMSLIDCFLVSGSGDVAKPTKIVKAALFKETATTSKCDVVSEQEQVDVILEGLPEGFNSFVMMIYSRFETPTVEDVEALLFLQDVQFEKFRQELANPSISTNIAHTAAQSNDPIMDSEA